MRLLPRLIDFAYDGGYELSLGEGLRTDEQAEINALGPIMRAQLATLIAERFPGLAAKIRNNGVAVGLRDSVHRDKLAVDLNLFRSGVYLDTTESHRQLGEFWEKQHPLCRWGGRWGDGNHYSIEHDGRK